MSPTIPYKTIFEQLEKQKIKYLVAGGFAVNFHQVQRATVDLDLIIALEKENILAFIKIMNELGMTPRLPVKAENFADEKIRKEWIEQKGMLVFSFINPKNPLEVIDIFSEEPLPFEQLWERRLEVPFFNYRLKVIGKEDLIRLKEVANRDKDQFDVQQLKKNTD